MKTTTVVFVRHGESEWNKHNLFCGWHDAELSERGIEDASKISARALIEHKINFDVAFSSELKRAQQSLSIILKELDLCSLPITYDWRLNERHYGSLIGYNKRQMADKYGENQVKIWRRSFDVCPPPITPENPYYQGIRCNPSFSKVPINQFPDTESLLSVMNRVIPFWEDQIRCSIKNGKRVLIVAHGTVLRALIKHIEGVSDENIASVNVPNSIPYVYEFDTITMKPKGKVNYLADENFLNKQMEKTASVGK